MLSPHQFNTGDQVRVKDGAASYQSVRKGTVVATKGDVVTYKPDKGKRVHMLRHDLEK